MAWSPDSKYITCGSIDRRAHVWEIATKRSIATLEDHANYVQCVCSRLQSADSSVLREEKKSASADPCRL
ncbi:unnamed protein product [Ectocarpus sp. 12 AP-2014]